MGRFLITCIIACAISLPALAAQMAGGHAGHAMTGGAWTAQDDADFLYGMIAHHEGAVAMSKAVENTARSSAVRKWARDITEAQNREIADMRRLINESNLQDGGAGAKMAADMKAMMDAPVSNDPDINFVKQMIPHHAGAIEMALPALVGSDNKRIRKLAEDIIEDQADEIYEFREWLDKHEM